MKSTEFTESSDEIKNPLGTPPPTANGFIEHLKTLEHKFAEGLFGQNLSGNQYVEALKEIDNLGYETNLPIKQLITTENKLSKTHLTALVAGNNVKSSGKLPKVYLYKSKYYLTDGNHRVAAELLKGAETVFVHLNDAGKLANYVRQLTK